MTELMWEVSIIKVPLLEASVMRLLVFRHTEGEPHSLETPMQKPKELPKGIGGGLITNL